jgi:hypothetical protein
LNSELLDGRRELPRFGTRPYVKFVNELNLALGSSPTKRSVVHLLNGRAGERCLDLVRPQSVRRLGAFFTPSNIAQRVVKQLTVAKWDHAFFFDPACGAADLLIPIAKKLPLRPAVSSTLQLWNERIWGCDISPEFIEAARLRLVLLAVTRGCKLDDTPTNLTALLSNLFVADGLSVSDQYSKSSHIVMNPPFGRVRIENDRPWREGTVCAAALFMERAATLASTAAQIVALLPEVLRTGTSYAQWRSHISQYVTRSKPRSIGLFSSYADVDVFIQHFKKRETSVSPKPHRKNSTHSTIGDHFIVNVGTVVPHRHPKLGAKFAYLHSKNASPWDEIQRIGETRKFWGRTFAPPFVVLRRTSRPGEGHRAIATLVLGKRRVAVENHLIVLLPRRGSVPICRRLMCLLHSSKTDVVLDQTMRCRHLTTGSVSSLPWF